MHLIVDEAVDVVPRRKTRNEFLNVQIHAACEMAGDVDVERTVAPAGENVNARRFAYEPPKREQCAPLSMTPQPLRLRKHDWVPAVHAKHGSAMTRG